MIEAVRTFESDMAEFKSMGGSVDSIREFSDAADRYAVDFQYLMMDRWAFDRIMKLPGQEVYDFASKVDFAAYLSAFKSVKHYDIREPDVYFHNFEFRHGDLLDLPIEDGSVSIASCLHVAEHVGLGRYGDKIDPDGFYKACLELSRVAADGGNLFFAVPTGIPSVVFNSHRVLSVDDVICAFPDMDLLEFSAIGSRGDLAENAPLNYLESDSYGCGLFHFVKRAR